jgi:amino acid transporter/nucleotide-binding universal stress UspA family protein
VSGARPGSEGGLSSELSRELTLFHITMMGLGMMIGAGVFLGIGNSIREAGPGGMVLTFALNGAVAILTAMSYAELSSAVPRAGGAYNFARIGFGRGTSFIAGWMEWFASSVAGSLYAVVFGLYVGRLLRTWGMLTWVGAVLPAAWAEPATDKGIALLVAALFVYINYRGASETGKIGAIFTLGQTLFLLVIGVIGVGVAIWRPERMANFVPFMPKGWERLLVTMGLTYVAFEGYEVIAQAGDEAIEPRRNLPKAMIYSVFVVTITYVLTAFATVVSVRPGHPDLGGKAVWQWVGDYGDTGFGEAVSRLIPVGGNLLLTLAVIFASTSALNATIYSATRASYALGRDRMLPAFFARIHSVRKTPWVALLFTGLILMTVACLDARTVVASASAMFLLLFFLVNVCVIKIRRNMGDELTYGYVMPFFPFPPLAAIACQLALLAFMHELSLSACAIAAGWVLVGLGVYTFYSRTRAVATEDEIRVLEEEREPEAEPGQYRVMVPVANPRNAVDLVRNTYKICQAKDASVELLHMVPVPEQVPLSDAAQYMLEGKEGIVEAMLYLAPQFPLNTTIRYCRNIARGIVSAVRQKRVNMLIMGWHGRTGRYAFRLGSTVDPVIERSPCDVVVMKNCSYQPYRRVLVPLAGGPNGALALEVASILAEKEDGRITALTVCRDGEPFDVDAFVDENASRLALPRERIETRVAKASDVTGAILKEAEEGDYDLVVLGATREPFLRQITRETIPDLVAQRCSKPLVMVKAAAGLRSWIKRWI